MPCNSPNITIFLNIWLIDYFLGNFFPVLATLCRRESARRVRFAHAWSSSFLSLCSLYPSFRWDSNYMTLSHQRPCFSFLQSQSLVHKVLEYVLPQVLCLIHIYTAKAQFKFRDLRPALTKRLRNYRRRRGKGRGWRQVRRKSVSFQ